MRESASPPSGGPASTPLRPGREGRGLPAEGAGTPPRGRSGKVDGPSRRRYVSRAPRGRTRDPAPTGTAAPGVFSRQCRTMRSRPGDVLVRRGDVRRVFPQDRVHRLGGRVAAERALARQHLVEDRAEREDVGARVGGLAAHLLGRHVAERAQHDARAPCRRSAAGGSSPASPPRVRQLRQPEVEDLDAAVLRHEHVLRLQVAVDDALLVRRGQAVGDLHGEVDGLAGREPAAGQSAAQRLAFEQLPGRRRARRRACRCRRRR